MRILKRKILGNFDKGGENFKNLCLQKKCNFFKLSNFALKKVITFKRFHSAKSLLPQGTALELLTWSRSSRAEISRQTKSFLYMFITSKFLTATLRTERCRASSLNELYPTQLCFFLFGQHTFVWFV